MLDTVENTFVFTIMCLYRLLLFSLLVVVTWRRHNCGRVIDLFCLRHERNNYNTFRTLRFELYYINILVYKYFIQRSNDNGCVKCRRAARLSNFFVRGAAMYELTDDDDDNDDNNNYCYFANL